MANRRGIGQSEQETRAKIEDFRGLFAWNIEMSKRALFGQPYRYIDLTAGPGRYEPDFAQVCFLDDPDGIPSLCTVALEILGKKCVPYEASLFEQREDNRADLTEVHGRNPCVSIYGDSILAPDVLQKTPAKRGLICWDSNGVPDFALLARLSRLPGYKLVDILIHLPACAMKRGKPSEARPLLTDELLPIRKSHLKVQQPRGQWQWTWLLLSNYERYPDWPQHKFYGVATPEGQAILERLAYSDRERGNGASIERAISKLFGVPGASSIPSGSPRTLPNGGRRLREVPGAATYRATPPAVSEVGNI